MPNVAQLAVADLGKVKLWTWIPQHTTAVWTEVPVNIATDPRSTEKSGD